MSTTSAERRGCVSETAAKCLGLAGRDGSCGASIGTTWVATELRAACLPAIGGQ
ncbi:MAG: hypothetical protein WCJ63_02945 [Actinomycetes bacterium]